jgi:uncharacterized protein
MTMDPERTFTAFAGNRLIATGSVETMLRKTKARLDAGERATVLVFEDSTGAQVDFDFRGRVEDVLARLPSHPLFAAAPAATGAAGAVATAAAATAAATTAAATTAAGAAGDGQSAAAPRNGPGRPKLGVVSREVTLLPRHWEWLEHQPNGISAALRHLVDEARRRDPEQECARRARDAANRFMTAMAGNLRGYEEATRALFADDRQRLRTLVRRWPADIRKHLERLLTDRRAKGVAGATRSS